MTWIISVEAIVVHIWALDSSKICLALILNILASELELQKLEILPAYRFCLFNKCIF